MDYRDLVFLAVASNMNISRAAEELHISQPAVSKHIKEMESKMGIALLERRGNRVYLTKAGEKAFKHLNIIKQQYSEMEFDLAQTMSGFKGSLRVGASSTIAQYVLPAVLAAFHKRYPEIKVSLLNGNSVEIEKLLLERKVDIALVENESLHSNINYYGFMKDRVVAVTATNSVYAGIDEITPAELNKIPLLLRERGSGTLEVTKRALQKKGIDLDTLNIFMNLGTTEAIKNFLENFDGIALMSEWAVKREVIDKRFKTLNIKGLKITREFRVAFASGPLLKTPSLLFSFLKEFKF